MKKKPTVKKKTIKNNPRARYWLVCRHKDRTQHRDQFSFSVWCADEGYVDEEDGLRDKARIPAHYLADFEYAVLKRNRKPRV